MSGLPSCASVRVRAWRRRPIRWSIWARRSSASGVLASSGPRLARRRSAASGSPAQRSSWASPSMRLPVPRALEEDLLVGPAGLAVPPAPAQHPPAEDEEVPVRRVGLQPGVGQGQAPVQLAVPAQVGGGIQGGLAVPPGHVGLEDPHGLLELSGPGGHPRQDGLGFRRELRMDLPVPLEVADGLVEALHPAQGPGPLQEGVRVVLPELQHAGVDRHGLGQPLLRAQVPGLSQKGGGVRGRSGFLQGGRCGVDHRGILGSSGVSARAFW